MAVDVNGNIDKHHHLDVSSLSRTSEQNYVTNVTATDEEYGTL